MKHGWVTRGDLADPTVAVDVELATDTLSMVGGRAEDGTHFTFQAAREEDETVGQLTVGQLSVDPLHGNRPSN